MAARLLTILLCLSCGTPTQRVEVPPHPQVGELAEVYRDLTVQGWHSPRDCDALLFNALRRVGGIDVRVWDAQDVISGQWFRTRDKDCFDTNRSASDFSGDMGVGLLWSIWRDKDLDTALRLRSYGHRHFWIMGRGPITRTLFRPQLIDTLDRIIKALRGQELGPDSAIWLPVSRGYERHVQLLHVLLRGEINGYIPAQAAKRVRGYFEADRGNVFFQAAHRLWIDPSTKIRIEHYPADRLPVSSDWCEAWPVQRDKDDEGLYPCSDKKTHSGGEILFIDALLKGEK